MSKDFKVLTGRYIPSCGVPVIVACVSIQGGSRAAYYTENAFFLPDRKAFKHIITEVSYNPHEFPAELIQTATLLTGEIEKAQNVFNNYFFESHRDLHMSVFCSARSYEFTESKSDALLAFQRRGIFAQEMELLMRKTFCLKLKEHIRKVLEQPSLTYKILSS